MVGLILDISCVVRIFSVINDPYVMMMNNFAPFFYPIWLNSRHALALPSQVAQVVAQALQQADTDVAIEAWAVRDAEQRDLAQLMAEVCHVSSACTHCCLTLTYMICNAAGISSPAVQVVLKTTQSRSLQGSVLCRDPL